MSWLKQTMFKRLKGTWGVRFSGIVGADGKYRRLSNNSSAGKKKMRLLCVSLHPSLFKYVPKCQVKPHQLMATRSWCFGCVLRCSDAPGIWKVRTAATTRCKQRWPGLFVWKKNKISHACCKLAKTAATATCSRRWDLVGTNDDGRNELQLGLNPQRQEHLGAWLRVDISSALATASPIVVPLPQQPPRACHRFCCSPELGQML